MKISFDNQSLRVSSKKFNPFNFSIYGIDVKSEKTNNQVNPFDMLENLTAAKKPDEDVAVVDRVRAMRSVLTTKTL